MQLQFCEKCTRRYPCEECRKFSRGWSRLSERRNELNRYRDRVGILTENRYRELLALNAFPQSSLNPARFLAFPCADPEIHCGYCGVLVDNPYRVEQQYCTASHQEMARQQRNRLRKHL